MSAEPKLALRKVVPLFTLQDKYGREQNLAKQRGRHHLLLIVARDGELQSYLHSLAGYAEAWQRLPARAIVVMPDEDAAGALGSSPFSVLIDQAGRVADRFLPADASVGAFVLDRYGELYHQWLVTAPAELPTADDLNSWMEAISMQCSV